MVEIMTHETPQQTPERQRWQKVRRSIGALGYLAAATFGGIGANAASPSSAEIGSWYQVEAQLTPTVLNQVTVDTSINPIVLRPDSPTLAPGIRILPHLQPTVLDSFKKNGNKLVGIEPTQDEVMTSLESLARQMGLKFAGGALGAALIYGYLVNSSRPKKSHGKIVAGATAGVVAASMGLVGGMYSTYNPKEQWGVETEGILAEAYANRDLFNDISKQSSQVSSKVSAILQLVNSIETTNESETTDGGVKFLLVSDIHGMDIGPILKDAVEQYHVSAVIFSGDLLNYGTVSELEASGIPAGIASIGVPFVAVTGNHDKTSPSDPQILERLATIKNVVLLQPDDNNYTTVTIGGVNIGGFNDPRNGFDGQIASDPEQQLRAASDFLGSVPLEKLDVAVAHENIAAKPLNNAAKEKQPLITINGHGHKLDLHTIGSTINIEVGSATAGGLTNPNRYNPDGKNIKDIPDPDLNSFDILSFGSDCIARQLTRIQYTIGMPRQVLTRTIPLDTAKDAVQSSRICSPTDLPSTESFAHNSTPLESLSLPKSSPSVSPSTP
jgi:predicted phosphodiesterase